MTLKSVMGEPIASSNVGSGLNNVISYLNKGDPWTLEYLENSGTDWLPVLKNVMVME